MTPKQVGKVLEILDATLNSTRIILETLDGYSEIASVVRDLENQLSLELSEGLSDKSRNDEYR